MQFYGGKLSMSWNLNQGHLGYVPILFIEMFWLQVKHQFEALSAVLLVTTRIEYKNYITKRVYLDSLNIYLRDIQEVPSRGGAFYKVKVTSRENVVNVQSTSWGLQCCV